MAWLSEIHFLISLENKFEFIYSFDYFLMENLNVIREKLFVVGIANDADVSYVEENLFQNI